MVGVYAFQNKNKRTYPSLVCGIGKTHDGKVKKEVVFVFLKGKSENYSRGAENWIP